MMQTFRMPRGVEKFILSLRLPKVLYKAGFIKREYINLFGWIIVDGYFQNERDYSIFSFETITEEIKVIRNELTTTSRDSYLGSKTIYHIRLGDFFKTEEDQIEFIRSLSEKVRHGSYVISNRDDLFLRNIELLSGFSGKGIHYVDTSHMNGLQLINFLSQFEKIISNGSSLSFASVIFFSQIVETFDNLERNSFLANSFIRLSSLNNYLKSNSK